MQSEAERERDRRRERGQSVARGVGAVVIIDDPTAREVKPEIPGPGGVVGEIVESPTRVLLPAGYGARRAIESELASLSNPEAPQPMVYNRASRRREQRRLRKALRRAH